MSQNPKSELGLQGRNNAVAMSKYERKSLVSPGLRVFRSLAVVPRLFFFIVNTREIDTILHVFLKRLPNPTLTQQISQRA